MTLRFNILFPTLILFFLSAESQKISKNDKLLQANLQTHIQSLSADTTGGRAMGTAGEKATGDYVISALSQTGAKPKGDNNGWVQTFTVDEGRQVGADAVFTIDEHPLAMGREWFPLALSPAGEITGSPAIALQESGVPWFQDLKDWLEAGSGNPRFDLVGMIRAKAVSCGKKGATALILYNSSDRYPDKLTFDRKDKSEPVAIPVLYITHEAKRKYLKDESASVDLHFRVSFSGQHRTGHNVIGFMDNGAAITAVIGTRYENSSGLAALLELARLLGASKLKSNNYLFIVFSGDAQGWPGSDYYTSHPIIDFRKVNYLLELDRLGTLNDTTHALTIGGYTTSPAWVAIGNSIHDKKAFSFHFNNISTLRSDHSTFYREQIPLLVFSTGPGSGDYPNDPVNYPGELQIVKYIYSIIEGANKQGRLLFSE